MRTAITLGYKHGSDKAEMLVGPDVPNNEHVIRFKKLPPGRMHPKFEVVEIWGSDGGITHSRKFISEKEQARRDEANRKSAEAAPATETEGAK
jgi:hypothetical protein